VCDSSTAALRVLTVHCTPLFVDLRALCCFWPLWRLVCCFPAILASHVLIDSYLDSVAYSPFVVSENQTMLTGCCSAVQCTFCAATASHSMHCPAVCCFQLQWRLRTHTHALQQRRQTWC
jgi:hypothetical protein